MAEKQQPEFYGDAPSGAGQKVPHTAGRQARLEAAGIPAGKSLQDVWREKADAAFADGSREDPGAEFQKVSSKQGRGNAEMLSNESMKAIQDAAKAGGKPISPESGLPMEPVTEGKNEGYSDEKKAALTKGKKSSKKAKE